MVKPLILAIDNYDSFTFTLVDYLVALGAEVRVERNDAISIERGKPLLGVCLGHQAIGLACGARVERVAPMHGKIAQVRHDSSGVFAGLPSPLAATRYHSLAVTDPAPPLLANAWSDDGLVMGMRHESAPVHGVQFHPESVASEHGHALLDAFLRLCTEAA